MTQRKTFTVHDPPDTEPVEFEIVGTYGNRHRKHGKEWSETFTLVPEMPVGSVALWQQTATTRDRRTTFLPGPTILFLSSILDNNMNKSSTRFQLLCDDPNRVVSMDELVDIMEWAVQELTGRPTGPVSSLPVGPEGTATSSEPESPPAEETPTV